MRAISALAAACAAAVLATSAAARSECAGLDAASLGVPEVTLTAAEAIAPGPEAPVAHCRVRGRTAERTGTDGRPYAISFELALPDEWNGGFVYQFNGGNDGEVRPAHGQILGGNMAETALGRGYAVISSDGGHDGRAHPEAGLAGSARFGFDPEARRDYGYGAVEKLAPIAKRMIAAYYGREIARSYGIGCSNGGRMAMVAASRFPELFDGFLVGAPGFNLPRAALQHAWDIQTLKPLTGDVRSAFSEAELDLVSERIVAACDRLDGLADGLVLDVQGCQRVFEPAGLACEAGATGACLDAAKVAALEALHRGPVTEAGEQLYGPWLWDPGIGSDNWRFWKLESTVPPWERMPVIGVMGAASLAQIFTTPPTEVEGSPGALEGFLLDFDLEGGAEKIRATAPGYEMSAMEFMAPPDVDEPRLEAFRAQGARMLIFHGTADPVFSALDTAGWYERLLANVGGEARESVRYYQVPGMPHCRGGLATDNFDLFTALAAWVEKGEAPGAVPAAMTPGNEEVPEAMASISRPLCPYPSVARYKGGDPAQAASFACE
ncbi:MAG TPA: tannase/feruloyl esterase family alpha/beta hydrolase [Paracoccaceae bacterium]|nr:tannase/feruloyl esterase family alpha/beta hydrolase [Paracoccaceae bacterium]